MRLDRPRIAPVDLDALDAEQTAALKPLLEGGGPGGGRVLNIFRTLARAPKALERFNAWGGYVLSRRNSLTPREREVLILRVGALCRSGYEFAQHRRIGREAGLADAEIAALKTGRTEGFSAREAALIAMAADVVGDFSVSPAVWTRLEALFTEKERMDAVFTAGQYVQVSIFLNAFGVQPEAGVEIEPEFRPA